MSDHDVDAVVVGGGVCGALVAAALSDAGKRVVVLEAGVEGAMVPSTYAEYLETYYTEGPVRGMPNGPYPYNPAAPSPGAPSDPTPGGYYVQQGPMHFMSDYLRSLGGTTLHWQGTSLRLLPNDFRMHSTYGQGRDWPITYDDLEPSYRRAEGMIGVSADVEDQTFFGVWFPEGYVYPMHKMPQSYVDQFFLRRLQGATVSLDGRQYPLHVVSIPQGRNSTPNPRYDLGRGYEPAAAVGDRDSGQRCQGNSVCLPICPVQAKYSALKTLESVARRPNVEVRTQSVASRLIIDPETNRISGVEYRRYETSDPSRHSLNRISGAVVVLAANAIENATLLLASGAANSSGQVGRNLMDHPYLYVWGLAPEPVFPFRGPDTTSGVESLRDGAFRSAHAAFRASISNWGWSGAPGTQLGQLLAAGVYGTALRDRLADQMSRMVKLGMMFEQLPSASNRVTIDPAHLDQLGNHRPVITYDYDDYCLEGIDAAVRSVWQKIVDVAGIEDHTLYADPAPPGYQRVTIDGNGYDLMGSGHIVGTHRMGDRPSDSVVDRDLRSWDHPNLFVVGTGSHVTIGTANPTLTGAALTLRATDAMLADLR